MAVRNHLLNTLVLLGFSLALALPGRVLANDAADGEEIDDIIVTATRLPRNIMEIAGTVSVVTGEDIERQVASDLDDLIRYQPGVTMNTNGRGGNMGFIIRGMGGNRVLTLIDGIRAGDSYARGPVAQGVDRFEVDDLKAVEIIRGPASVLYGSDAMGGAVILRTRDPIDYLDGDSSYVGVRAGYAGANELAKFGLSGATRVGDLGLFLQYTNRTYEEREIAGEGSLNPQDGESHGLLLKTVWAPGDGHRLKLSFETMREDNDFELLTELSSSVFESLAEDQMERSRVSLQYDWSTGAGFADSIETHVFFQTADGLQHTAQDRMVYSFFDVMNFATYFGEPGLRVSDFEFNQAMSGVGATFTKTFTAGGTEHALVYGLTYDAIDTERPRERYEVRYSTGEVTRDIRLIPGGALVFQGIDPGPYFEVFPNRSFPDTETRRTGVYVQDEIAFGTSGFTLIPGLRYERYEMDPSSEGILDISGFGFGITSVSESHTSANLGLIYDVNEEVALFAQYAEGFRPPNYEEANVAYLNYGVGYGIMPNLDLAAETSRGLEFGVKANLDNSFVSFAVYDNRYDDFIATEVIGLRDGITLFQETNIGKARIYGAELVGIVAASEKLEFNASIAYARGEDEEDDVPLDSVDPLTTVLGMRYSGAGDRWSIEPRITLVDAKDRVSAPDVVTASSYRVVDVVGSWNIADNAELRIGLFNLGDEKYARWANLQGLPADDLEAIALSQEPGFNVRAALSVSF